MGASVTQQREGFRPRLHELLCGALGQPHAAVNAGTGALGSLPAVFLMDRLVLGHRPDLCFVEFLSRDLGERWPPETTGAAVEAIVERLTDQGAQPCLLYLYRRDFALRAAPELIAVYEEVAERHGIPSIDLASPMHHVIDSGLVQGEHVVRDGVHMTPAGAQLVADAILDSVLEIASAEGAPRTRQGSLYRRGFHDARILLPLTEPVTHRRGRFRLLWEYLELGPGDHLTGSFDGELVGAAAVVDAETPAILLSTETGSEQLTLADPGTPHERVGAGFFAHGYPAGRVVRIELSAADSAAGKSLKLLGLLVRG